jgi:hypothetical protein
MSVSKVIEPDFMTVPFDRVLKELDLGKRATNAIMFGNSLYSMEDLLMARFNLAYGELKFVDPYNQLRLYFVTEWVGEFGLLNVIPDFTASAFSGFFLNKLHHFKEGTICISPGYLPLTPYSPTPSLT